jgi:hypothetical protein
VPPQVPPAAAFPSALRRVRPTPTNAESTKPTAASSRGATPFTFASFLTTGLPTVFASVREHSVLERIGLNPFYQCGFFVLSQVYHFGFFVLSHVYHFGFFVLILSQLDPLRLLRSQCDLLWIFDDIVLVVALYLYLRRRALTLLHHVLRHTFACTI